MENQPQPHKSRRKNSLPVRATVGPSSQLPKDSGAEQSTPAIQATSAVPPNTACSTMDTAETEKIMRDFLAILKPEERPSEVFAKMAEALRLREEASLLTSLHLPSRLSTLPETTTAQEISSATHTPATLPLPEAARGENAPVTASNATHAEDIEYTVDEVMEEAERVAKETEEGTGTEEDVVVEEAVGDETDIAEKEFLIAGEYSDDFVGTDLNVEVKDSAGSKPDLTSDVEGETPGMVAEGVTPVIDFEGEAPVIDPDGETPVVGGEGETLVTDVEGRRQLPWMVKS